MKINVNETDINKGVRGQVSNCAVARAVKRAFKTDSVWVNQSTITVKNRSYNTPEKVRQFIAFFDMGYTPSKLSFNIGRNKTKKVTKKVTGAKLVTVKAGQPKYSLTV